MQAADWQPEKHKTELVKDTVDRAELRRQLDADQYLPRLDGRAGRVHC